MNVLFCESFKHKKLGAHVDEVLFLQPVLVSGCRILDEDEELQQDAFHFRGITDPSSFSLKIFARNLKKSQSGRFSQVCPSFVYQDSAEGALSFEPTVTDHLVVRGSYKALSLVVYGVRCTTYSVRDDGTTGSHPATQYSPFTAIHSVPLGLLSSLRSHQCEPITPLSSLRLAAEQRGITEDGLLALRRAVQGWHTSGGTCIPPVDALLLVTKSMGGGEKEGQGHGSGTPNAKEDPDTVYDEQGHVSVPDEEAEAMVHMSLSWIQEGLLPNSTSLATCSSLDRALAGVAAAELLCSDPGLCYRWVAASGLHWLGSVLLHARTGPTALQLATLRAIERASRHGFGCEVLLSWWQPGPDGSGMPSKSGPSMLYETLVSLLLRPQLRAIGLLAASITRRLRAYELSASLQRAVEGAATLWFTDQGGMEVDEAGAEPVTGVVAGSLQAAASALKNLVDVVVNNESDISDWPAAVSHPSPAREIDAASGIPLPSKNYPGPLGGGGKASLFAHAVDVQILHLLLERRTLPLLAMLFSAPQLAHLQGQAAASAIALLQATYALLLPLLHSSTGLVFLASQGRAVAAIAKALSAAAKEGDEAQRTWAWLPLRWALSLAGGGYLCSPQQMSNLLSVGVGAVSALDAWLGSSHGSQESLVALHGLVSLRANTAGQQALLGALHLPQAWKALMCALPSDAPRTTANATGGALAEAQYGTMLLSTLVLDPTPASFNIWLPHSSTLQAIAQQWMPTFESSAPILGTQASAAKLMEIQDAAEVGSVWHKRAGPGLVQLVATLTGSPGAKPAQTEGGTDALEPSANPGGATAASGSGAGAGGAAGVGGLDGKGTDGTSAAAGAASLTMLLSSGTVKLPMALNLLVPLMNHGATATALYREDVVGVMQHILGQCASSLLTLSPANGPAGDWIRDADTATKERHILNVVLPALLILLAALRRVQMAGSQYRSTKLVDVLIRLHHAISSCADFNLTVPPGDPSGDSTLMAAVRQALASVLAAWPGAGFSPPLLPRLLGQGSNSDVVSASWEPVNASGLFSLLGDMLPECRSGSSSGYVLGEEALWAHATGSLMGLGTAPELSWQSKAPHVQQLVRSLNPHADALAALILRFLPLKSEVVHRTMVRFVMRLASADAEAPVALVRPLVDMLQNAVGNEQAPVGVSGEEAPKGSAMWEMLQALNFLMPLASCGASKASLLQSTVVPTLVRFVDKMGLEKAEVVKWQSHALASISVLRALCNPGIAMNPRNSLARRVADDCPKFADCCEVATSLLRILDVSEPGATTDILLRLLTNLASHDVGRAALASVASPTQSGATKLAAVPLLALWKRIASGADRGLESARLRSAIVRTSLSASRACIALAHNGASDAGVAALCVLVGSETSGESMEHSILNILASLRAFLATLTSDTSSNDAPKNAVLAEACEGVEALITTIQSAPKQEANNAMDELVKAVLAKLLSPRPVSERKQGSPGSKRGDPTLGPLTDSALWLQHAPDTTPKRAIKHASLPPDMLPADCPWECQVSLPSAVDTATASAKRKQPSVADSRPDLKRPRADVGPPAPDIPPGLPPGVPSGSGPLSMHRRDNFRQRKPNTSRPTSMHVDDYQARDRNGSETSTMPGPPPRSLGGGGRPPSIHVDEFMKREKHVVVGAPTSSVTASASPQTTATAANPNANATAAAPSQPPPTLKEQTPPSASRQPLPSQSSATPPEASAAMPPPRAKEEQVTQNTAAQTTPNRSSPSTPATSQTPSTPAATNQPPVPTTARPPQLSETAPLPIAQNPAPMPRMPPPSPRPPQMGGPGWGPMPPVGADGTYLPPPGLRPPPGPMWVAMDPSMAGPMPHMGPRMEAPPLPPAPSHIPPPPPPRPEFPPRPQATGWEYHPQAAPHHMDMQAVMRPTFMPMPDYSMQNRPPAPGMPYPMRPPLPYQQAPYPPLPQGGVSMEGPPPVPMMEPPPQLVVQQMEALMPSRMVSGPAVSQFQSMPPLPPAPAPPASLPPPPAPVKQPEAPAAPAPPPPTSAPPATAEDDETAEFQRLFSSPEAIKALIADQAKLAQLLQEHPKIMNMLQAKLSGGAS